MKESVSLSKFYEKLENNEFDGNVYIEKPVADGELFRVIKTLGKGKSSYVVLARYNKKYVALRMSYEKIEFEKKFHTIKMMMGDDYKKFLLDFLDSYTIDRFLFGSNDDKKEQVFDRDVIISVWEPADSTFKNKKNLFKSFEKKLEWFFYFLKGLSVIQKRSRVHLDINLNNLFNIKGLLKIGDFEFYYKVDEFIKSEIAVAGTPGYIAPEMFYDRNNVSTKCDIFSAGVSFCELFAGVEIKNSVYEHDSNLSQEEEKELRDLFGDKYISIDDEDMRKLFVRNFRILNFFRKELNKKLKKGKVSRKERKIYRFIDDMMEIDPEKRIDVNSLLKKVRKVIFDPESLVNRKLVKRYKVQVLIDSTGRGIVYKVLDKDEIIEKKPTEKAIKLFPPQFDSISGGIDGIMNELSLARDIPHRNVVNVYSLEKHKDLNFIVMEYINGANLQKRLDNEPGNRLKEESALFFMKQVASALKEAHKNGIIHRNLKTQNIMIASEDNNVKIINFGLSKKIRNSISKITGELYGYSSLLYLPPEHLTGTKDQENEQTDVWSFGAILYQSLTGEAPFAEEDKVRDPATLPPIADVSVRTKAVIKKCLAMDRSSRYRNMQEVYHALFGEVKEDKYPQRKYRKLLFSIPAFIAAVAISIFLVGVFKSGEIPKETYKMWYSGSPGGPGTPGGGIGYAASTNGVDWVRSKNNPVIPNGNKNSFNEVESSSAYVVHDKDYFHMFFMARNNGGDGNDFRLGYIKSPDGKTWDKNAIKKNPFGENNNIKFPGPMLYIDGYYKMWYTENDEIYHAGTTDKKQGILEMVRHESAPVIRKGDIGWDKDEVIIGSVLFDGGVYKIWYTGKDSGESMIGYAISVEGIKWTKYKDNPVFDDKKTTCEMNPCVIRSSEGYKMYYSAASAGSGQYTVYLATSPDGIKWEKKRDKPVLNTANDDWEKTKVVATSITVEEKE